MQQRPHTPSRNLGFYGACEDSASPLSMTVHDMVVSSAVDATCTEPFCLMQQDFQSSFSLQPIACNTITALKCLELVFFNMSLLEVPVNVRQTFAVRVAVCYFFVFSCEDPQTAAGKLEEQRGVMPTVEIKEDSLTVVTYLGERDTQCGLKHNYRTG